ncbi:hypothetical protein FHS16_000720 [Paenibacillus endophyticus]|uniref:SMI1/KNR4 family protein n=1 Tax=Paenibacillus endophyticus TaxID=1294268 RepID=A0A7W5G8J6_9BACL|nr:hypothetical protein [Paenibacillus endophyticus]MBB3150686.1 hypothetical protein [Paenibacillus endophyticus]
MDRPAIIAFIMEELSYTNLDKRELNASMERIFGSKGELTEESLLGWADGELATLYKIASGMRLTRLHVPNVIEAYASMDTSKLSSRVLFGQIDPEETAHEQPRIHQQYGDYAVPLTVSRLYELETEFGGAMEAELGLLMQKHDFRYPSTPPDFIPFASSGGDGIHYCFVTDFGMAADLEQAFIAAVSPMDSDSGIWLVARNINDFLRMIYTDQFLLHNNPAMLEAHLAKKPQLADEERTPAMARLGEMFGLHTITDLSHYAQTLREQRNRAICMETTDTVGIVPLSAAAARIDAKPLSINWEDGRALIAMLREAEPETKLAIIRDAQHLNRIPADRRLLTHCKLALKQLGLYHEAYNLMELDR